MLVVIFYSSHTYENEIKPVISYVKNHEQLEMLSIYSSEENINFYTMLKNTVIKKENYIIGVDDLDHIDGKRGLSEDERQRYQNDLDELRGNKRVLVNLLSCYC